MARGTELGLGAIDAPVPLARGLRTRPLGMALAEGAMAGNASVRDDAAT
jgi:hypothetical protein